jgi:hypothetical protein
MTAIAPGSNTNSLHDGYRRSIHFKIPSEVGHLTSRFQRHRPMNGDWRSTFNKNNPHQDNYRRSRFEWNLHQTVQAYPRQNFKRNSIEYDYQKSWFPRNTPTEWPVETFGITIMNQSRRYSAPGGNVQNPPMKKWKAHTSARKNSTLRFSRSPRRPDRLWAHPASYPMGNGDSFPGGKAAGARCWPLTSN